VTFCVRQGAERGGEVDRASTTVVCDGAGYTKVLPDLPVTAVTVDLSNNALKSIVPLSRLRHVVNLRLRGNRISSIYEYPSASPGRYVMLF